MVDVVVWVELFARVDVVVHWCSSGDIGVRQLM